MLKPTPAIVIDAALPFIIEVEDYHEFAVINDYYKKLNTNLKCKEVAFIERDAPLSTYLGIVYFKKLPSKKEMRAMVRDYCKTTTGDLDIYNG